MLSEISYESVKKSLLLMDKTGCKTELTIHEHDALSDAMSAYKLGKVAYQQHLSHWATDDYYNWSESDVEYAETLILVDGIIEEKDDE